MTKEEIVEMAKQAGFEGCAELPWENVICTEELVAFAKLVAEKAIKEALAQEQEPVGQLLEDAFGRGQVMWFNKPKDESMLYTTPHPEQYPQIAINPEIVGYVAPQRTWVGLTDEEANKLWVSTDSSWELMMLTEAKLKDKNTQKTTGENNLS